MRLSRHNLQIFPRTPPIDYADVIFNKPSFSNGVESAQCNAKRFDESLLLSRNLFDIFSRQ